VTARMNSNEVRNFIVDEDTSKLNEQKKANEFEPFQLFE
jgi:hypothetical protein